MVSYKAQNTKVNGHVKGYELMPVTPYYIYSGGAEAYNHRDYHCAFGQKSQDFLQVVRFLQIMVHFL